MATNYYTEADKYIKKYEEEQTALGEKKKEDVNVQLDQQIEKAESDVQLQKGDLQRDYEDIVDAAAIQKELDRRQIAETMANLGLTRSGLNAGQQTAVELSAGNKVAVAQQQRQEAVDSLTRSLAEYKMEIENTRRESINSIDEGVQSSVSQYSADLYKDAADATSADYQAGLEHTEKMAELELKQAEQNSKDASSFLNKSYRLASVEESEGTFEFYDPITGKIARITKQGLINGLQVNDKLSLEVAESVADELLASFARDGKIDYATARKINGTTNDFDTLFLGASAVPNYTDGSVNADEAYSGGYNERYNTKHNTVAAVRNDYICKVLTSGLTAEEMEAIFAQMNATEDEIKEAHSNK